MSSDVAIASLSRSCPDGWKVVPLESVVYFQEGPGILAKDFRDSGIPLLRLKGVERDVVTLEGCNFLDPVMVAKKWSHFRVNVGDLLISTSASLGRVSEVTEVSEGAIPYTGLIRFKPTTAALTQAYLKVFLSSAAFTRQAESMASGSVIKHFGPSHIRQMAILLPPVEQQAAIGKFASMLDEQVRLLRETNSTLEAIAQAIFKSWFIDFDPVKAKSEGRTPDGIDEATAALFPDSFEESALGAIPKGWIAGTLADVAYLNAESWTAKRHPEKVIYIDLANAKNNELASLIEYEFDEAPSRARRVLRHGDTIVGTVRPGNRSFAFIDEPADNLTASTGFAVLRPKSDAYREFVFLAATNDASIDHLAHVADGGAYPAVRPDVVAALQAALPPAHLVQHFHELCAPMLAAVAANQREAQTLTELRDTLLPRLISGKLKLPELQEVAEAL